jgi:ketose-bisphosphate aldolase
MPLASLFNLIDDASRRGYAVCYCESWNLESLQAVIEAAEESRAPIIAGFNGGFLRHAGRAHAEDLAWYAGFRFALEQSAGPAAFLLNESDDVAQIKEGIRLGFNAVMLDNEGFRPDDYGAAMRQIVMLAHTRGVWVEAQLGRLPGGHSSDGELTDPDLAATFVRETGVDALGVSAGNVHVLTEGKATLDLDVIRRIKEKVDVPLVLHGGTGLTPDAIRQSIELGVAKLNFGTILKESYLAAVREKLAAYRRPLSPHPYLGMGGEDDIMIAGREAVKAAARELIAVSGSGGRAPVQAPAGGRASTHPLSDGRIFQP